MAEKEQEVVSEQWNIPANYDALVASGAASYSILGVLTADNSDSMSRFVDAVDGLAAHVEEDDGTQIRVAHPDPAKIIVIDAGGLGDFYDSGFDVTVQDRDA
jgi:hypothetical protein